MKTLLSTTFLILALIAPVQAWANISIRPAASVNNYVITVYDLQQRINFILLRSGTPQTEKNRLNIAEQALESMISETLHLIYAESMSLVPSEREVETAILRIEQEQGIPEGMLREQLRSAGIDYQTFFDLTRAGLAWEKVVYETISPTIDITDIEIAREMERLKSAQSRGNPQEVRLQMLQLANTDQERARMYQEALQLRENILSGAKFSVLAREFSTDVSAQFGGDLGWIAIEATQGALKNWLLQAQMQEVSPPINLPQGVSLFKIQDKRRLEVANFSNDEIRERIGNVKLQSKIRALELNLRSDNIIRRQLDL